MNLFDLCDTFYQDDNSLTCLLRTEPQHGLQIQLSGAFTEESNCSEL